MASYEPGPGDMEVEVGPVSSFVEGARSLIRAGTRNVAVYLHKGKFYAIDNACYHHGGPLHNGDIEDLGGHPCVICPWHSYRIALDTGEGLYIGLDLSAKKECVKSKGLKQRVHPVIVRDGKVIVQVQTGGTVASDDYATMAIANQEQPTGKPTTATNNLRHIHSKGSNVFKTPEDLEREKIKAELRSKHLDSAVKTLKANDVPHAKCISRRFVSADKSVVSFVFDKALGFEPKEALKPGMWATLELPLTVQEAQAEILNASTTSQLLVGGRRPSGNNFTVQNVSSFSAPQYASTRDDEPSPDTRIKRTYTVITSTTPNSRNRHGQGWFSIAVKNMTSPTIPRHVRLSLYAGGCGSRWLHEKGHRGSAEGVGIIQSPEVRVVESGGHFSMAMERTLISKRQGRVLLLSGGIGITPIFASVTEMLQDDFMRSSGPSLHMYHVHVDNNLAAVPFLPELLAYSEEMKKTSMAADPMSYHLALYCTKQGSLAETKGELVFGGPSTSSFTNSPHNEESDNTHDETPSPSSVMSPTLTRVQPVEDPFLKGFGHKRLSTLRNDADALDDVLKGMLSENSLHFGSRPTRAQVIDGCKQWLHTATDFVVFLCGPEPMIAEWSATLEEVGVQKQCIITERFDF